MSSIYAEGEEKGSCSHIRQPTITVSYKLTAKPPYTEAPGHVRPQYFTRQRKPAPSRKWTRQTSVHHPVRDSDGTTTPSLLVSVAAPHIPPPPIPPGPASCNGIKLKLIKPLGCKLIPHRIFFYNFEIKLLGANSSHIGKQKLKI